MLCHAALVFRLNEGPIQLFGARTHYHQARARYERERAENG